MLIFALALAAAAACPVENAHYRLRQDEGVTLAFFPIAASHDWPSGMAAVVHFDASGRNYYFLPWNGGTNDRQNLAYTTDVTQPDFKLPSPDGGPGRRGDIEYIATDDSYAIIDHAPMRGDTAPAHILLPDLRGVTWYSDLNARDGATKAFFDFDGCVAPKG